MGELDSIMREIGIPALVVVMLLREVRAILKERSKQHSETSGDKPAEFWMLAFHEIVDKVTTKAIRELSSQQLQMIKQQEQLYEEFLKFRSTKEQI